jgi:multiple sugar transport system ATP-binding protein
MASVKLTDVKKVYDNKVTAVHDFNLDIKDKEFIVFVGPSGCGKSTTLRMVAGLEDISGGTVEIDGEVVNDLQPKDRDIAMVFQNYALYPHMTVYDNIAFSLRLKKVPEDEIFERVTNAAEILGITEYLTRKPRALSGGQRQRVAIGRAMVRNAKVFLMDEPLSNLDAKLRNQMRAEIILLRQKLNTTFIYVTHDQTEAMTMGDRIVVMRHGVIQQIAPPVELYDQPANLFVAGFIGTPPMNLLPVTLERTEGGSFIRGDGFTLPLPDRWSATLADTTPNSFSGKELQLGIRPEHVGSPAAEGDVRLPRLQATVEFVERLGSETCLHVCAGGSRFIAQVDAHCPAKPGDAVALAVQLESAHLFDPKTTLRIV